MPKQRTTRRSTTTTTASSPTSRRSDSNASPSSSGSARPRSRARLATPPTPTTPLASSPISADFHLQVYSTVRQIPEGKVSSYGRIATLLGHPRHSRLVGAALKVLPRSLSLPHLPLPPSSSSEPEPSPPPNPDWVPWHRVVSSTGVISPRGNIHAVRRQADWLEAEGVEVRDGVRVGAAGGGGGGGGGPGVDAFGLGGVEGGRVSMARYAWP